MSSSIVTCPNCGNGFDVCTYAESDKFHARPLTEKERPWECDNCGCFIDFMDEKQPWLGLKTNRPDKAKEE